MKKFFLFCMVALVTMCGLNSCSDDCDHNYIEVDYSKALVGTWTLVNEGYAEALIFNADGTVTSTGVLNGGHWEKKGTFKIKDNQITLSFEDGSGMESRFEMVEGQIFSMVDDELDVHFNYYYCENDLSDEIVGMWVCTETPSAEENDMLIMTYNADGTTSFSGYFYEADDFGANKEASYKVIGDLLIHKQPDIALEMGLVQYSAMKIKYTPNGTALGDIKTLQAYAIVGDNTIETTTSWLRIRQTLDLAGKAYDYSATYISNAKGEDKDVPFLNTSFNFAKMDGSIIDKFLKSTLFSVEFPDANTFKYSFLVDGQSASMSAPIEVEGNKMTIKMSANNPALHDVEIYTFQDQDNTQMHLFMPTTSFEKFFANTSVYVMLGNGQLDENNTEAIAAVYQTIANAVESINLSIVMK